MQKIFQDRRLVLGIALLALFALVLLAGSLNGMDFQPGQPIGGNDALPSESIDLEQLIQTAADIPFWKQVMFWVSMFVILLLITSLMSPQLRKQLLLSFVRAAIFVMGFLFIVKRNPEIFGKVLDSIAFPEALDLNSPASELPPPVFEAPQVSEWFTFLVALIVLVLGAIFFWWLSRFFEQLRQESTFSHKPLNEIARIARKSIQEIQTGANFENSILECYSQMSAVVAKKKGLQRGADMTAGEFSAHLTRSGLPAQPVQTLTRLFESARYGVNTVNTVDATEAVTCLKLIVQACGETF